MLEKVKAALRIKSSVFDEEVGGVIAAALADLKRVGIAVPEWPAAGESDPPAVTSPDYAGGDSVRKGELWI